MRWFFSSSGGAQRGSAGIVTDAPAPVQPARTRRSLLVRIVTSVLVVSVIAAFVVGVATNHLPRLAGGSTTAAPIRGGSIVSAILQDTTILIPQLSPYRYDAVTDAAIWAPLWYGQPDGALHPGLASEVPSLENGGISADLKAWTIHLKPRLKWSDGSPLTAADVAYSLNTFADPRYNVGNFPVNDPSDPINFLGATVVNSTTVHFTLAHPYVAMNANLADGFNAPIPQEVFGSMAPGDIAKSHQTFFPTVTSGPFKVSDHVPADHLTVVRNPYYYQGPEKPYLDQITFKPALNGQSGLKAAQAGTLDAAFGESFGGYPQLLADYRALSGYTTYFDSHPAGYEIAFFNLTNPILADNVVRQALTMSLDPKQIIAQAAPGLLMPICDDHAGTIAHEPSLTCYKQNPVTARQLLDADGWTLGTDGFRHKDGKTLELLYTTMNVGLFPLRLQTEQLVQTSWARIGVKVDVKNYSGQEYLFSILPSGQFDVGELASSGGYDPDDSSFFMCNQTPDKEGGNYMRYCNATLDQAEQTQLATADQAKRLAAFHTIDSIILDDLPVMYYYVPVMIGIYRSTLHNFMPFAIGDELWNCGDWYLTRH